MMTGRCVLPRWPARPVPTELKALENVVLLPHLGSATEETRVAMGMRAVENLVRFFDNERLLDPVVQV